MADDRKGQGGRHVPPADSDWGNSQRATAREKTPRCVSGSQRGVSAVKGERVETNCGVRYKVSARTSWLMCIPIEKRWVELSTCCGPRHRFPYSDGLRRNVIQRDALQPCSLTALTPCGLSVASPPLALQLQSCCQPWKAILVMTCVRQTRLTSALPFIRQCYPSTVQPLGIHHLFAASAPELIFSSSPSSSQLASPSVTTFQLLNAHSRRLLRIPEARVPPSQQTSQLELHSLRQTNTS